MNRRAALRKVGIVVLAANLALALVKGAVWYWTEIGRASCRERV